MSNQRLQEDTFFMTEAIRLAQKGTGFVAPNPLVGAVLVRDGKIIGAGYHARYGSLHAERAALADAKARGEQVRGARLYVTLEPCCHQGHQPPCTDAILEAGIRCVIGGSDDPNPKVGGKGYQILEEAGISVERGFMKEACDGLNTVFFHFMETGRPYIHSKFAMSLDGKIATRTGDSRGLSAPEALLYTHQLRQRYSAILVGKGTVLADDPSLTCRLAGGRDPVRIILDHHLSLPEGARLIRTARQTPTLLVYTEASEARIATFEALGVDLLQVRSKQGKMDLEDLLDKLAQRQIDSVLVEGGSQVHASFFEAGLVNAWSVLIAPKLVGGGEAPGPIGGLGLDQIQKAFCLSDYRVRRLGKDLLIESEG